MSVCLGMLTARLMVPESHSLKERRSVVSSLKEKIRKRCNVSISDASPDQVWQRAELHFACAAETEAAADAIFRSIIRLIDEESRCELMNSEIEYYA